MPDNTSALKTAASNAAVKESQRRAGWESANRRSNISSDADVSKGLSYVAAPIVNRASDYARIDADAAMSKVKGSMKKGGKVPSTGIYKLHKGEHVIPTHRIKAAKALMSTIRKG